MDNILLIVNVSNSTNMLNGNQASLFICRIQVLSYCVSRNFINFVKCCLCKFSFVHSCTCKCSEC